MQYIVNSENLEMISLAAQLSHGLTRKLTFPDELIHFARSASAETISFKTITRTSELDFTLTSNKSVELHVTLVNSGDGDPSFKYIDWGDGTIEQDLFRQSESCSFTHTYAAAGDYTVKLTPADGVTWSPGSNGSDYSYCLLGMSGPEKEATYPTLTAVRLGDGCLLDQSYGFYNCTSLKTVSVQKNITSYSAETFTNCPITTWATDVCPWPDTVENLVVGLNRTKYNDTQDQIEPFPTITGDKLKSVFICPGALITQFSGTAIEEIWLSGDVYFGNINSTYYVGNEYVDYGETDPYFELFSDMPSLKAIHYLSCWDPYGDGTFEIMGYVCNCDALTDIYFYDKTPPSVIGSGNNQPFAEAFCFEPVTIHVPADSLAAYETAFAELYIEAGFSIVGF